ncbi:transcriptional regulator [Streptomyces hainanensis]|uniref:Transcriptional regulator n=2 Tax=Streptomyces hainanensis TaxID=402648 RepID=A0A4R4TRP5_9ACTN|nr:transcriptional regulator [Streptomyces hainanensis]
MQPFANRGAMAITTQQRRELGAFLRNRRERLAPEAAGISESYGRRRTPGLRREELAQLAGVSVTWYTWLEQARKIKVSSQVLGSLARALRLDETETSHLFRLAGEVSPSTQEPCRRDQIPAQYVDFLELQDPLPAFISNDRFDVLAWTQGFCVLFSYFESLPPRRRNSLAMMFDSRARYLFPEWEKDAMEAVALFRAQAADQLVQPEYANLVHELERDSADFRTVWERLDLAPASPSVRLFDHPVLGRIELGYVKLRLAAVDATLVVYQPLRDRRLLDRIRDLVEERMRTQLVRGPRSAGKFDGESVSEHVLRVPAGFDSL